MPRLSPDLLAGLGACVLAVHLLCALVLGSALLKSGSEREWRRQRLGLRGTSTAGLGLTLLALVVFWNRTPSRVGAGESWVMLAGLLVAAGGQAAVIRSLFGGGATSFPVGSRELAARLYAALAPLVVLALFAMLWVSRGMH